MRLIYMLQTLGPLVLTLLVNHCTAESEEGKERVCQYDGQEFHVGELVTGDVCDPCYCTQHGIMCAMVRCPTANCHDKVKKECCYTCPNGPNCLFEGENSTVLVPETGCTYTDGIVCHCYHDDRRADKEKTVFKPALPGDNKPPCQVFEP